VSVFVSAKKNVFLFSSFSAVAFSFSFTFISQVSLHLSFSLSDSGKSWFMLLCFRWKGALYFSPCFAIVLFWYMHWLYSVYFASLHELRDQRLCKIVVVHFQNGAWPYVIYLFVLFILNYGLMGTNKVNLNCLWQMACEILSRTYIQTVRGSFGLNWCSWLTSCQILFLGFIFSLSCHHVLWRGDNYQTKVTWCFLLHLTFLLLFLIV